MTVAVLSHDRKLSAFIGTTLAKHAIACRAFEDDINLMRWMRSERVDLVIVDGRTSLALVRPLLAWRQCHSKLHFDVALVGDFNDRGAFMQARVDGVEEFLRSPIDAAELVLRTQLALSRSPVLADEITTLHLGAYRLNKLEHKVYLQGSEIALTAREFATAWLLFSNPGVTLDRAFIARAVWGSHDDIATRTLEQHIYRLRKKLNFSATQGVLLRTIYAGGYRLQTVGACWARDPVIADSTRPRWQQAGPSLVSDRRRVPRLSSLMVAPAANDG